MYRRQVVIDDKKFEFAPGTNEQFVFKEVLIDRCYDIPFTSDDVVLNIGGHIGSFDVYLYDKVKQIITYEPDPANYAQLLKHLERNNITNVESINKAVADRTGKLEFTIAEQSGHNTSLPCEYGTKIEVECDSLEDILARYPITKIKCDCEGGEIEIFSKIALPDTLQAIIMETHDQIVGEDKIQDIITYLESQGFECRFIKNDEHDRTHLLYCLRS